MPVLALLAECFFGAVECVVEGGAGEAVPGVFAPGGGGECATVDAVGDGQRFDAEEYGGFGCTVEGLLSVPVVGVWEAICDVSQGGVSFLIC